MPSQAADDITTCPSPPPNLPTQPRLLTFFLLRHAAASVVLFFNKQTFFVCLVGWTFGGGGWLVTYKPDSAIYSAHDYQTDPRTPIFWVRQGMATLIVPTPASQAGQGQGGYPACAFPFFMPTG